VQSWGAGSLKPSWGHWWVLVHCGRNMFCLLNSERLDGAPDTTSPPNGEGHEYHNHGSTLIPSMLYDEITVVFRFTSGIFKTLLLNLNLFALNIILILQTNKVFLLGYQHIPANCLLSNAIRMYFGSFSKINTVSL
jgi:hypothetical protein